MNFFEKIIRALEVSAETPVPYGIFHLVSILAVIITTTLLIKYFKDCDDKTFRRITLIFWIIFVVLEIYKQTHYTFEYNGGDPYWDFQWYAFPFQFCSSPHYVLPFVIFMKDGKVRDAAISFMSFYCLVGGIAVFLLPTDVFTSVILNNFQTMYHHGTQIILGIFFIVHRRKSISIKYVLKGLPVLGALIAAAMAMNIGVYHYFMAAGIDETFNMFYISPYFDCTLPVLSSIYKVVPYPVFLALYVIAVLLGATVIYLSAKAIERLIGHLSARRKVA